MIAALATTTTLRRTTAAAASFHAPMKKKLLLTTAATTRNAAAAAAATATRDNNNTGSSRSITVGTDLLSSTTTTATATMLQLQKARPWHRKITESNLAIDNAISLQQLFGNNNNNNHENNNQNNNKKKKNKIVGVFGIPAPFTGTCTCEHYPGYHAAAAQLRQAGMDELVCYAVTDPYSHYGWKQSLLLEQQQQQQQQQQNNNNSQNNHNDSDNDITFLADPDASFAVTYGIDRRYDDYSLGLRSERFRMIVVNGIVMKFALVDNAAADAQEMLRELRELQENYYLDDADDTDDDDELFGMSPAAAMSS